MSSSASRRTVWRRIALPSRSPANVPSVEMTQLIASLLQRAPAKFSGRWIAPSGSSNALKASSRAGSTGLIAPIAKPPSLVRSKTPGSGMLAPNATMPPRTIARSSSALATRSSQRPF